MPFTGNSAEFGGAILNNGELSVSDSEFSDNVAGTENSDGGGGAIGNFGELTISNSAFTGNSAEFGGSILNNDELTISNSVFTRSSALIGGAIYNGGELSVADSEFSDNVADTAADDSIGGAIFNNEYGTITNTGSIFTRNSAQFGGAIGNRGELTITNSTFARNSAAYAGGSIYVLTGTATLTHLTLADNTARQGGGGLFLGGEDNGTVNLRNSIIALSGGGDCFGRLNQDIGNMIQDGSCFASQSGSPSFGTLVEPEGGSPAYYPLVAGSPAIDAAHPAYCLETDQRGARRPQGAACDIGAYEYSRRQQ